MRLTWIMLLMSLWMTSRGQHMAATEARLVQMSRNILGQTDLEAKKQENREFTRLLMETLRRPESYDYPFDSLNTVSILRPADNSFRLFTWHIADRPDPDARYGEENFYYFGLVQRRYITRQGREELIIIPLIEMPAITQGIENMVLDNNNWLGGQYYPIKNQTTIPAYTFKYADPRNRTASGEIKRTRQTYYLLLGWNGMDNTRNMKFVETMSFDPKDSSRVIFGANVFYFDPNIPKYRALYTYSEYAPFTMNFAWVKTGPLTKRRMIVYDHLANPRQSERKFTEIWEMGPDGSYDALGFNRWDGSFQWYKNVQLAEKYNSRVNQKALEAQRAEELKKMQAAGIQVPGIQQDKEEPQE
ncbi:MAG: hypothetical protein SF053_21180 [Bacteroidia bacterium]|nr:hypothetical protein [Bacteroidia bacterium]